MYILGLHNNAGSMLVFVFIYSEIFICKNSGGLMDKMYALILSFKKKSTNTI